MDGGKGTWVTREDVRRNVIAPLSADPVAGGIYDFAWDGPGGGQGGDVLLWLEGNDQGQYLKFDERRSDFDFGLSEVLIRGYPAREGWTEEDWVNDVRGAECGIEGSPGPEDDVYRLIYGDPSNLVPREDLLAMAREAFWAVAGATGCRARSLAGLWRKAPDRVMRGIAAERPELGICPEDCLVEIPRYVVEVDNPCREPLSRFFANIEIRVNGGDSADGARDEAFPLRCF